MTTIYVCWETVLLEGLVASALLSDNATELRHLTNDFERASEDLKRWVMANGGSVIMDLTTKGCLTIPPEKASDMSEVQDKFEEMSNNEISMGMGMTISEAFTALRHSKQSGHKIALYTPEMEQELANDGMLDKSELRKDAEGGEEAAPAQDGAQGDGMGESPADVQTETGQAPSGSNQATGQVEAAPQGSGATNIDEAERAKDAASQGGDSDPKAMIMSALQEVKSNAGAIEKLKTTSPAAYDAVKDVIQAMIQMAESMTKSEGDFEIITKGMPVDWDSGNHTRLRDYLLNRTQTDPGDMMADWKHLDNRFDSGRGAIAQHVLNGVPHVSFPSLNFPGETTHVVQGPTGGYMIGEDAGGKITGIDPHAVHANGQHPNNIHAPDNQDVIAYEKEHHPQVQKYRKLRAELDAQEAAQAQAEAAEKQRQIEAANKPVNPEMQARVAAENAKPGGGVFGILGAHAVPKHNAPAAPAAAAPKKNIYGSAFSGVNAGAMKPAKQAAGQAKTGGGLTGNDKVMSDYHTNMAADREKDSIVADKEIREGEK